MRERRTRLLGHDDGVDAQDRDGRVRGSADRLPLPRRGENRELVIRAEEGETNPNPFAYLPSRACPCNPGRRLHQFSTVLSWLWSIRNPLLSRIPQYYKTPKRIANPLPRAAPLTRGGPAPWPRACPSSLPSPAQPSRLLSECAPYSNQKHPTHRSSPRATRGRAHHQIDCGRGDEAHGRAAAARALGVGAHRRPRR